MKYLYTAGYGTGWSGDSLGRVMEVAGAVLVDIRQAPWSRSPQWQKSVLVGMFAERYVYLPALGNLNYRGGPIRLANPGLGAEQIYRLLQRWPAAILLCGCKDVAHCHRKTAAEHCAAALAERLPLEVVHLSPEPEAGP